ncbi:MAG: hypothetical protein ACI8PY_000139, partial [Oceanospirillaceae bacterium]
MQLFGSISQSIPSMQLNPKQHSTILQKINAQA